MMPSRNEAALAVWEAEGGRLRAALREPARSAMPLQPNSLPRRRLLDRFGLLDTRIAEALGSLIAPRTAR